MADVVKLEHSSHHSTGLIYQSEAKRCDNYATGMRQLQVRIGCETGDIGGKSKGHISEKGRSIKGDVSERK
jgi:hypothetical protein